MLKYAFWYRKHHDRCDELLRTHWEKMEALVTNLMEVETIDAAAFEAIMRGEDPFAGTRNQPPKKPTREVAIEKHSALRGHSQQ